MPYRRVVPASTSAPTRVPLILETAPSEELVGLSCTEPVVIAPNVGASLTLEIANVTALIVVLLAESEAITLKL